MMKDKQNSEALTNLFQLKKHHLSALIVLQKKQKLKICSLQASIVNTNTRFPVVVGR